MRCPITSFWTVTASAEPQRPHGLQPSRLLHLSTYLYILKTVLETATDNLPQEDEYFISKRWHYFISILAFAGKYVTITIIKAL